VGYTPNMAGAVWVGDPAHKRQMYDITIGGVTWGKVYGGKVPGPIWRDMMTDALAGKPALDFNLVDIPDDHGGDKGNGDGHDKGRGNGNGNGGQQTIGGLIGGLTTGGAADNGGTTGGQLPTPTFSFPNGFIQGAGNGGNGNGTGGRRG
jgi:membrane peptidoglycan carboxypeptidase